MSAEQKKMRGTFNKTLDGKPSLAMVPLKEKPIAPKDFTDYERQFFDRVAGALFDSGILREVDVMQIEMHAMWWHVYCDNRREVCDKSVQTTEKGWKQISGNLTAVEKACKMLQSFGDRYGLNLISKDKISQPKVKSSEFDDIMNGRT
jgi:phage terminase small subunit